jgi:hypothetical protein
MRCEKLRMFPECLKLFDLFESVCLERKMYSDDLKKDIQVGIFCFWNRIDDHFRKKEIVFWER